MALLTAEDILNKKFAATKFREGYDVEEVDDYLDEVVRTISALTEENENLKAQLAAAEQKLAESSRQGAAEAAGQPLAAPAPAPEPAQPTPAPVAAAPAAPAPESAAAMLGIAQKVHDETIRMGEEERARLISEGQEQHESLISEAKNEGARIVREAEEKSNSTLAQLEQERSLLERKIDELRIFERDYRTRLSGFLQNLLGELDQRGNNLPSRSANPQI
ncbi:MAG: DivIVA domain-containing protein [Cellulomonadaceae bacterium]|jgi:DivIVA domain-containing protein|nr:DivIVA domain-containing protein [Cellulomonadaceae bacterium]